MAELPGPDDSVVRQTEANAPIADKLTAPPPVTLATAGKIRVLGAGETVGGVTIADGWQGVHLGDPETGELLVVGTNAELNAWVEHLRHELLDIPTGSTCFHCLRPITRRRIDAAWADAETGVARCRQSRDLGVHRPPSGLRGWNNRTCTACGATTEECDTQVKLAHAKPGYRPGMGECCAGCCH